MFAILFNFEEDSHGIHSIVYKPFFQGFWLYSFITTIEPIGYGDHVIPDTWELIGWLIAAFPFVAIPAAAIHGCMMMTDGSCSEV